MARLINARDNHISRWVIPAGRKLLIEAICNNAPTKPLGEVTYIEMGQSPDGNSCNNIEDGIPLVGGPADLGLIFPQTTRWTNAPTKVCRQGDIIVCVRATIGEPRWADGIYCLGRGVAGIRPVDPNLDPQFLFHIIEGNEQELQSRGTGTTFKTISKQDLSSIVVPLIPREQQEAIGKFLLWLEQNGINNTRPDFSKAPTLPNTISEQRRIVARIEEVAAKIEEAQGLKSCVQKDIHSLLLVEYKNLTKNVKMLPMSEVAPLVRRPVQIDLSEQYPELGIRSFGKGTFHKPAIGGAELGTKKIFEIRENDLLFNIVFAWEGAVAVAQSKDDGRVGSHRFLTCVPKQNVATSTFLCFHFLTEKDWSNFLLLHPEAQAEIEHLE